MTARPPLRKLTGTMPGTRSVSAAPLAILAALTFAALPARSAPRVPQGPAPDSARVARLADAIDRLAAFGYSGQILVAEHGQLLIERAIGWADRRFEVPMSTAARLGIGSVTKDFVAAAILRLQTQGRLKVGDPIARYLEDVPKDKARVTIEQLLAHTGGIRRDVSNIPDSAPRDEVVRRILAEPLIDTPGRTFHYSNSGYDLLAAIVERVSGESFAAFSKRELLDPAGLTATGTVGTPELPPGPAARGYNEWEEVSAWTEWPAGWKGTGSGRMVSTAHDLWRWFESVRHGVALRDSEWKAMSAPHATEPPGQYGFGIHIQPTRSGGRVLILGGDVDGYRAEARWYPDFDRVILVLINQDQFGLGVSRRVVASALSRLAQNQEPELPPVTVPWTPTLRETGPVGSWRLPSGGTIDIWEDLGQLRLGANGQDAIDLFEPDPGDSTGRRARVARATETVMRAAVLGDSALARTVLDANQYAFAFPFLRRQLAMLGSLYSGLQTVRGLGVVSLPWDPDERRSYLILRYLDRDVPVFLGWNGLDLVDVTFERNRPDPVLYPVAPLAGGGYAAWDMVRSRAIRFRLLRRESGEPRLVLRAVGGDITARRVR